MAQTPSELTPQRSALHLFGSELRRLRNHHGLSQEQLGRQVHVSGHLIGKIEKAQRRPSLELARLVDQILGSDGTLTRLWPRVDEERDTARWALPAANALDPFGLDGPAGWAIDAGGAELDETGLPMRRREFGRISGAAVAAALVGAADGLVGQLTTYLGDETPNAPKDLTLPAARRAVATAKRNYQAGRYLAVFNQLPLLLDGLRYLAGTTTGGSLADVDVLMADAYHVAGSVLLKIGDAPLATLVADRAITAARHSGDPVAVASSARIVTHALMTSGHPDRAHRLAADHLSRLRADAPRGDDADAVAGALMLRGAVAAARAGDATVARALISEAESTARTVRDGANTRWTGFNTTNVDLHRVSVELALGEPFAAIAAGVQIDPSKIGLRERRACLHLDLAQAHVMAGRHDRAIAALREAAHVAPQEVRNRPGARRLLAHLCRTGPHSARRHANDLATQVGTER